MMDRRNCVWPRCIQRNWTEHPNELLARWYVIASAFRGLIGIIIDSVHIVN